MRLCSIEGCNEKHEAKGYCKSHYRRYKKYGDPLATPVRKEYSRRKPKIPYHDNHKIVDGIEYKLCSDCDEWYPMTEEHYYKNKSNDIDGFYPYCKKCSVNRVIEKRKDPLYYQKHVENQRKRNLLPEVKEQKKKWRDSEKGKINRKEWTSNHRDKIQIYNYNHMHKQHDITNDEWECCKSYFGNSCAYCGIHEEQVKVEQGQKLHMEHALNNGSNKIDNCIPACKICNSSKWKRDFDEWYNPDNPIYTVERYERIVTWLETDYKMIQISII